MKGPPHFFLETVLFFILFFAPFFFGASYPWIAQTVCGLIFLTAGFFPEALSFPSKSFLIPALFLLIAVLFQSFLFSWSRPLSLEMGLRWLALAVIFLVVQSLDETGIQRVARAIVFAGLLQVFYGTWEVWSGHERVLWQIKDVLHRGMITGTYMNKNHCAGLLEMALGVNLAVRVSPTT